MEWTILQNIFLPRRRKKEIDIACAPQKADASRFFFFWEIGSRTSNLKAEFSLSFSLLFRDSLSHLHPKEREASGEKMFLFLLALKVLFFFSLSCVGNVMLAWRVGRGVKSKGDGNVFAKCQSRHGGKRGRLSGYY